MSPRIGHSSLLLLKFSRRAYIRIRSCVSRPAGTSEDAVWSDLTDIGWFAQYNTSYIVDTLSGRQGNFVLSSPLVLSAMAKLFSASSVSWLDCMVFCNSWENGSSPPLHYLDTGWKSFSFPACFPSPHLLHSFSRCYSHLSPLSQSFQLSELWWAHRTEVGTDSVQEFAFTFSMLSWMFFHVLQARNMRWMNPATTERLYLLGAS